MARRNAQRENGDAASVAEFATLLGKALAHPLRVEIINKLGREGRLSPNMAAGANRSALGTVSYHFRVLHSLKVLKAAGQTPRRGALEHFYDLTPQGERVHGVIVAIATKRI